MPQQKPGSSKQDYETPDAFVMAVKRRLRIEDFTFDLAASELNRVTRSFISKETDALRFDDWAALTKPGWGWLNPEFANIGPYAARCAATRKAGGQVAFLVPASVGANWFRDFVYDKALVLALNGRLEFMGPDQPAYPKDCILCLYSPRVTPGFDVWNWRAE